MCSRECEEVLTHARHFQGILGMPSAKTFQEVPSARVWHQQMRGSVKAKFQGNTREK